MSKTRIFSAYSIKKSDYMKTKSIRETQNKARHLSYRKEWKKIIRKFIAEFVKTLKW